jgi:hypothetical protein
LQKKFEELQEFRRGSGFVPRSQTPDFGSSFRLREATSGKPDESV